MRPRSFFQYVIGSFVQLAPGAPMQRVIWRGKQVVPSITGRQPYEVPVYRLDNDFWDCYHQEELTEAWRWEHEQKAPSEPDGVF